MKNKNEHLIYKEKITQEYSGFVFDFDGTLSDDNGNILDSVKKLLQYFTQMGIYVILATGRGPNDTDKLIQNNNLFTKKSAYSINFNGSLIRKILYNGNSIKGENVKEILLEGVNEIYNIVLKDSFLNKVLILKCNGESKYSDFDKYGITFYLKKELHKNPDIINYVYIRIVDLLNKHGFYNTRVTISGSTIDIFSNDSGKENGIITVSNEIGLESNSLLRVGDLGGKLGNDYCMLKDNKGFTVNEGESAIKIYSDLGKRLYGQQAIKQIIKDVKLTTSHTIHKEKFCNEDFYKDKIKKYSEYSKKIKSRFHETSNELINNILNNGGERLEEEFNLSKIFSFNGSVMFSKEEIKNLQFEYLLKYLINYGGLNYGRGKIFYFFEDFTNNDIGREVENPEHFNEMVNFFYSNFKIIIEDFNKLQLHIKDKTSYSKLEYKLYLMILDHLKSFITKFLHFLSFGFTIGLNITTNDLEIVKDFLTLTTRKYYEFFELSGDNIILNIDLLEKLIQKYKSLALINNENINHDFKFYNRILRGVPEVNHPYNNYIYGHLSSRGLIGKGIQNPIIIGNHFGGIEIPYILQFFLDRNGVKTKNIIGLHSSSYELENMTNYFGSNIKYDNKNIFNLVPNNDIIISDDGVFSGKTLLNTGLDLSLLNPKSITFTAQTFPGGRAGELYRVNGGVSNDFLEELFENGLVKDVPVFTGPSKNPNRLFNIEEQRILNIISKGKILTTN